MMKKVIFIFLIFLFSFLLFSSLALATTIFSPLLELEVEPGQSQRGVVKVYNETDNDLYLRCGLFSHWEGVAGTADCLATYHKTSWNFGDDGTLLKKGVSNLVLADGHTDTGYYLDTVDLSDPIGWKGRI